jgi:hypothetical protein
MLLVNTGLVFAIGIPLIFLAGRTDTYFAWTIAPPLTAAFLGGGFWASLWLEFVASQEIVWARARIAVPAVFVFSVLTGLITLAHLDRFHLGGQFSPVTTIVTWGWLVVYVLAGPVQGLLWLLQTRAPGQDERRIAPLPGVLNGLLLAIGLLLAAASLALLVSPVAAGEWLWPWQLTPLTGRAVGAWLLGIGLVALHAAYEDDWVRLPGAMAALAVFGALQLVALARYPGDVRWERPSAWLFVAGMIGLLALGVAGAVQAHYHRRG